MKGIWVTTLRPLTHAKPPIQIPHHVRLSSHSLRVTRVNQRPFSASSRRLSDGLVFKKYSLPSNKENAAVAVSGALTMSDAKEDGLPTKRTAYIALGSNLGDRIAWIEKACNEMDARGIKVKRTSSLWETEPMYVLDQDRFVNGACEVCTSIRCLFIGFSTLTNPFRLKLHSNH